MKLERCIGCNKTMDIPRTQGGGHVTGPGGGALGSCCVRTPMVQLGFGRPPEAVQRLLDIVFEPAVHKEWLHAPNKQLGDAAPVDLIVTGRTHKVVALLDAVADGVIF